MDAQGGFFYERWGDAPVHSLAVAMMLKKSEVHFFNDIGYKHNPLIHCPIEKWAHKKCSCEKKDNFGKLIYLFYWTCINYNFFYRLDWLELPHSLLRTF